MNGAESLIRTLIASGVEVCFANAGTSEIHFVLALDKIEEMRCILGMAETVVTGCADGYARMAEKPAMTLLHCGPGFANGIANVHNARRATRPPFTVLLTPRWLRIPKGLPERYRTGSERAAPPRRFPWTARLLSRLREGRRGRSRR
jgi:Thiamine pyrophosphate enzyme, N-terminal TPP binding domain